MIAKFSQPRQRKLPDCRNHYLDLAILTDLADASGVRLDAELQLTGTQAITLTMNYSELVACFNF